MHIFALSVKRLHCMSYSLRYDELHNRILRIFTLSYFVKGRDWLVETSKRKRRFQSERKVFLYSEGAYFCKTIKRIMLKLKTTFSLDGLMRSCCAQKHCIVDYHSKVIV